MFFDDVVVAGPTGRDSGESGIKRVAGLKGFRFFAPTLLLLFLPLTRFVN